MADPFTENVSQQLERLLRTLESGTGSDLPGDGETETAAGIALTPTGILQLLAGDTAVLDRFENGIERRFDELGKRVLAHWLEDTDKKIRDSLLEVAEMAIGLVNNNNGQGSISRTQLQQSLADGSFSRNFDQLIARSADTLITSLLTRTDRSTTETERSQQNTARYKASRGQQQAQLAEEISRGRRFQ